MKKGSRVILSICIVFGLVFGAFRYQAGGALAADVSVQNGGFESGVQGNGTPNGWGYWPGNPSDNGSGVTADLKAEGGSSFRFVFADKEQGLYNNVALPDYMQAYEVTCWLKAESLGGEGARVIVEQTNATSGKVKATWSEKLTGTFGWTQLSMIVSSPTDTGTSNFCVKVQGFSTTTGTLYVDDFKVCAVAGHADISANTADSTFHNSSFENGVQSGGSAGSPNDWGYYPWNADPSASGGGVVADASAQGGHAFKFNLTGGEQFAFTNIIGYFSDWSSFDFTKTYRVSCWMKAEDVQNGGPELIVEQTRNDPNNSYSNVYTNVFQSEQISGTTGGWVKVDILVGNTLTQDTPNVFAAKIECPAGTTGMVYVDNLTIEPVAQQDSVAANSAPVASAGSLFAWQGGAANGSVTATDADGNTLAYSLLAVPSHGTISGWNAQTGAYTYTPAAGFTGDDSFTFLANDGRDDSDPATVTISVQKTTYDLQMVSGGLQVTVNQPDPSCKYQIWSYNLIDTESFGVDAAPEPVYKWVLWKTFSDSGFVDIITSPSQDTDGNYRLMILTMDSSQNVRSMDYEKVLPDQVLTTKIQDILVNGKTCDGAQNVDIGNGSNAVNESVRIVAANADTYTFVNAADGNTNGISGSDGVYMVNFQNYSVGTYAFNATVQKGGVSDCRQIIFNVYSSTNGGTGEPPVINGLTGSFSNSGELALTMDGTQPDTNETYHYAYQISEPGLGAIQTNTDGNFHMGTNYGIYQIFASVRRDSAANRYDDAIIRDFPNLRPVGQRMSVSSVTVQSGVADTDLANMQTHTTYSISPVVSNPGNIANLQYSFWRSDERGWVLLQGWSPDATLHWTPAYIGNYIIQVRIKGDGATSYEDSKNVQLTVKETGMDGAKGTPQLSIPSNLKARQPVTLRATVSSADANDYLLYRFDVVDSNLGEQIIQSYSPSATCVWYPRKAYSNYTIKVMILNQNSFGMYDQIDTVEHVSVT